MLSVEDSDITDRLLPPKLDKWRKRRDRRVARREKRKAKKKKEREETINKRRQELIAEADERKAKRLVWSLKKPFFTICGDLPCVPEKKETCF